MTYTNLIRMIKTMAGAREDESQDALEVVVGNVAANLTDYTRRGFAARLPRELQQAAETVPTMTHFDDDIIEQLMDLDDVDESRARRYVRAAWDALLELFDSDAVDDITAELPPNVMAVFAD